MSRRIITSLLTILVAAVVVVGATTAFFSDTETSVGNTFAAGDIDLQIDNTSYAIDWNIPGFQNPTGAFVASTHTSWTMRDLTVEKFFDFVDLKPGDYSEDTISIHVGSNDAWVCAAARITDDNDNTYVEPEVADDLTVGVDPLLTDGELDDGLNFAFWVDDGDNVFEDGEQVFLEGPLSGLGEAGQIALADSNSSILSEGEPIPGGETFYIGKIWCFGDLTPNQRPDREDPNPQLNNPVNRGTGWTCDGSFVNNAAQTDVVVGDLQFYAEQARHNDQFSCRENWKPVWPSPIPSPI